MQKIRWALLIVGIFLALALALQNNTPVPFRLLWMGSEIPLSILMLSTTAVGFLCGALLTVIMLRRGRKKSHSDTHDDRAKSDSTHQAADGSAQEDEN